MTNNMFSDTGNVFGNMPLLQQGGVMSLDLFGALNSYGPLLNMQQQSNLAPYYSLVPYQPNLLAPYYEYQAQLRREAFYRSCSQHWLDAMLDIELGLTGLVMPREDGSTGPECGHCGEQHAQTSPCRDAELVCPACGASGGEYPTCTVCGTLKVDPSAMLA
jgi:hypothetical protein